MSNLKQLPIHDRPRERLLRNGPGDLSDAELLAVLLRTGVSGTSALGMGQQLLERHGGLGGLLGTDRITLRRRGMGDAKVATLLAAFELGRRLVRCRVSSRDVLDRPAAVANYLNMRYNSFDQEIMGVLYLDLKNRLIAEGDVFRGTLSQALVEPRAIFKEALLRSASGMVIFHNHPSGDPRPSLDDLDFTRRMAQAGELLGIRLVDHMILGSRGGWVSLKRRGAW